MTHARITRIGVAFLAAMVLADTARADDAEPMRIEDGDAFSIDVRPLAPCMKIPAALRREDACAGLSIDRIEIPPAFGSLRVVAVGFVPLSNHRWAWLMIWRDEAAPDDVTKATIDGLFQDKGDAESPLGRVGNAATPSNMWLMHLPNGEKAARIDLDITGGTGVWEKYTHEAILMAGRYRVELLGPREAPAQVDALLDSVAASVQVAPPRWSLPPFGEIVVLVGVSAAAVVLAIGARRRKGRSSRPTDDAASRE